MDEPQDLSLKKEPSRSGSPLARYYIASSTPRSSGSIPVPVPGSEGSTPSTSLGSITPLPSEGSTSPCPLPPSGSKRTGYLLPDYTHLNGTCIGQTIVDEGTGKRRVKCNMCGNTYCDKGALKIHFGAVHKKEKHKCTVPGCNKTFSSRRSRNRHSENSSRKLHDPLYARNRSSWTGGMMDGEFDDSDEPERNTTSAQGYKISTTPESDRPSSHPAPSRVTPDAVVGSRKRKGFAPSKIQAGVPEGPQSSQKSDPDVPVCVDPIKGLTTMTDSLMGARPLEESESIQTLAKPEIPPQKRPKAAIWSAESLISPPESKYQKNVDEIVFRSPSLISQLAADPEQSPERMFPPSHTQAVSEKPFSGRISYSTCKTPSGPVSIPVDEHNPRRCVQCNKLFQNHFSVKTHYLNVHLKVMHKCIVEGCNAAFPSKRSRDRHSQNRNMHQKLLSTGQHMRSGSILPVRMPVQSSYPTFAPTQPIATTLLWKMLWNQCYTKPWPLNDLSPTSSGGSGATDDMDALKTEPK